MRAKLQLVPRPSRHPSVPRSSTPCSPWPHRWRPWRPSCSPSRASARPTSHRPLFVVAPALTAASTPFMFVSVADPGLNALLFGIGAVATGIGSALLWAMWGEYYAVIPRDRSEWLAPVSAVSAAVIVLLVSAMDGWVPSPSPRRSRFCPAYASISRGRQKPPAPKRRSQPPIASQPSGAPPWRDSGARGSASSSCSPS